MTVTHPLKNGQTLLIREAESSDAAAALDYVDRVTRETDFLTMGPGDFEMTLEQEAAFLESCKTNPQRCFFMGFIDGNLIGMANVTCGTRPRLRHRGEFGISVLQSAWGLGVGGLLLDHLIGWARDNPVLTKLDLRVRSDNERAIALYRQRGFVEEGLLKNQIRIGETHYHHLAMGLNL